MCSHLRHTLTLFTAAAAGIDTCEQKVRDLLRELPDTADDAAVYIGSYDHPYVAVYVDTHFQPSNEAVPSLYNSILVELLPDSPVCADLRAQLDVIEFPRGMLEQLPELFVPTNALKPPTRTMSTRDKPCVLI